MKKIEEPIVLITGVGDTVGQALVKTARASAVRCRVLGTDRDKFSVGFRWVDERFVLPHCFDADAYLEEMRRICLRENVHLILPGSEKEFELLSANAESFRHHSGTIVVASPPDVLRIGMDKWETCRFLERAGRNFPGYARADKPAEVKRLLDETGFPLIAKPIRGTGARGFAKINSMDELEQACAGGVAMVVQEYLEPAEEEYSVEIYTLKNGEPAGDICYRRDQLIAGDTYKARVMPHNSAQAEARAIAAALGARGPCNVQLRVTDRGPVTFEINPRFSGGVSMRAHFGFNEVEMAIRDLVRDEPVPEPAITSGLALRFWEEMYLDDEPKVAAPKANSLRILGTHDATEWLAVLASAQQHDFHHLPQYHIVAEQRGEGIAQLFVYREREYTIALPLLLRPVDANGLEGWSDATSVYGYGGPVASHEIVPPAVVQGFQQRLTEELHGRRVVALFSRLHPLISQAHLLAGLGECPDNGETISIDLTSSEEEQRARYNKSCRRSLRQLRESGFIGMHDPEKRYLPEFTSVYLETMRRAGAQSSYFFDEAYFNLLTRVLDGVSHLFVALKDGEVAAATLCTLCCGIVQDHLGGTRDAFLKYSPDRLVVDTERAWATQKGARVFNLGGGVGAQQDSVFRYKAGFSDRRHIFRTWRWILRPEIYQELTERSARVNLTSGCQALSADYFPAYRCPTVTAPEEGAEAESTVGKFVGKEGCLNA